VLFCAAVLIFASLHGLHGVDAAVIECTFNSYDSAFQTIHTVYQQITCTAKNVKIATPWDVIVNSNPYYQNEVRSLKIENQECHFFPNGVGAIFNLQAIRIYNSGLRRIAKSNLESMPELMVLWLPKNKIEVIESDLFTFNTKLTRIDFSENNVKHIGTQTFNQLNQLESVNFNSNPCISTNAQGSYGIQILKQQLYLCQDSEALSNYKEGFIKEELEKFKFVIDYLKEEFLKKLDEKMEENEKKMSELEAKFLVSQENEKKLEAKVLRSEQQINELFSSLNELRQDSKFLDDSGRQLKQKLNEISFKCAINENACNAIDLFVYQPDVSIKTVNDKNDNELDATAITELSISNQESFFLPMNLANVFPKLQKLVITNSRMVSIDNIELSCLTTLSIIDFSNNQLRQIAVDDFSGLTELKELNLSNNRIAVIEFESFKGLVNLHKLILNENAIREFNTKLLLDLPSIKELHLKDNQLKSIKTHSLEMLNHLTLLDLTGNVCIDDRHPETDLKQLKATVVDKCAPPLQICCEIEDPINEEEVECR